MLYWVAWGGYGFPKNTWIFGYGTVGTWYGYSWHMVRWWGTYGWYVVRWWGMAGTWYDGEVLIMAHGTMVRYLWLVHGMMIVQKSWHSVLWSFHAQAAQQQSTRSTFVFFLLWLFDCHTSVANCCCTLFELSTFNATFLACLVAFPESLWARTWRDDFGTTRNFWFSEHDLNWCKLFQLRLRITTRGGEDRNQAS